MINKINLEFEQIHFSGRLIRSYEGGSTQEEVLFPPHVTPREEKVLGDKWAKEEISEINHKGPGTTRVKRKISIYTVFISNNFQNRAPPSWQLEIQTYHFTTLEIRGLLSRCHLGWMPSGGFPRKCVSLPIQLWVACPHILACGHFQHF